jgi:hypothetical protein
MINSAEWLKIIPLYFIILFRDQPLKAVACSLKSEVSENDTCRW